jgi:putative nucleotidyltransferase with HDIG domain
MTVVRPTPLFNAVPLIEAALALERAGNATGAIEAYTAAAASAPENDVVTRATALRRCASIHRRRQEFDEAIALCKSAIDLATATGERVTTAETLNTLALVYIDRAEWTNAAAQLTRALELAGSTPLLVARIEQNFGIIANIQGDFNHARQRYLRSLMRFREARDEQGCAIAYHNLGMLTADQRDWRKANEYFAASLKIAVRMADIPFQASVLLNRSEVQVGLGDFDQAFSDAEKALDIFTQLGNLSGKADAYRALGVVFRELGLTDLAEQRFRAALKSANAGNAPLQLAEATRDLALLYIRQERNHEALTSLNAAHRLFSQLGASADGRSVASEVDELETAFLDVVARYGRSIESVDTYTYGHSERVASYAVAIAEAMALDPADVVTIRVGASLHDIGKVRIPPNVLNKPGKLTAEEFELVKMHPVWGLEILEDIEFPWLIKPIIRSHHEKMDGTGYPDGLSGDEIPLHAQIVCVADVFDAMTSARSYQDPVSPAEAVAKMRTLSHWFHPIVFAAFVGSIEYLTAISDAA